MSKRAVFIDIDGTLVDGSSPVPSSRNLAAMAAAQAAGHLICLCTGRSLRCMQREVLSAFPYDGIVGGGGSYVSLGGQVLRNLTLPAAVLRRTAALFLAGSRPCVFEGTEEMFHIHPVFYQQPDWLEITGERDFDTKYAGRPVNKLTIGGVLSPEEVRCLSVDFEVIQHDHYAEALPKGCCKSEGMRILLEAAHLTPESAVALGDSANDLGMLRFAGLGIAMGNASPEVQAAADAVTASADDDGVAEAIYRFILG